MFVDKQGDEMTMSVRGFHRRCGSMVTVSNNGRTAQRNHPAQEFNNGVVLSAEPMRDNELFEVKIDRKVTTYCSTCDNIVC